MVDAPLAMKLGVDIVLVATVLLAFLGRPPRRRRSGRVIAAVTSAGLTMGTLGLLEEVFGLGPYGELLWPGLGTICLARWLARAQSDEGGDDGGSETGDDEPPPPDWDAFDRAREDWSRPRIGT
jgi:hypothetical protein